MKICWSNLNKLHYKDGIWRNSRYQKYVYVENCNYCHEPFLSFEYSPMLFCSHSCAGKYVLNNYWAGHEPTEIYKHKKEAKLMREEYKVDALPDTKLPKKPKSFPRKPKQVRRGRPAGHRMSQETKNKIAKSRRGQSVSKETRLKILLTATNKTKSRTLVDRGANDGTCFVDKKGNRNIYVGNQSYIREHRWIAEKVLGRPLKSSEFVYHIDGNNSNNRHDNLIICKQGYAMILNKRKKAKI